MLYVYNLYIYMYTYVYIWMYICIYTCSSLYSAQCNAKFNLLIGVYARYYSICLHQHQTLLTLTSNINRAASSFQDVKQDATKQQSLRSGFKQIARPSYKVYSNGKRLLSSSLYSNTVYLWTEEKGFFRPRVSQRGLHCSGNARRGG